jgi:hypothetical protein
MAAVLPVVARECVLEVGTDALEDFLSNHPITRHGLHRNRRDVKRKLVTPDVNDEKKEAFTYKIKKVVGEVKAERNRFSDKFTLTPEGQALQTEVAEGLTKDTYIVNWSLYCPGQGGCKRKCGGYGQCNPGEILMPILNRKNVICTTLDIYNAHCTYPSYPRLLMQCSLYISY